MDADATRRLNLKVLQRLDPAVEDILVTAAHVTLYDFNIDLNQWSRKDVEGSLFVVKRNSQPRFQFIVMNRRNTDNLVEDLLTEFEYELQSPYLLYRNASQEVNGIWFYNNHDCEAVASLFGRILNAYAKVPPKPKVLSTKSEFEELEAVPTSAAIDGPLEPPPASAAANENTVNTLDDLLHDVAAEPINVQLAVLQNITKNFAVERKIGQGGSGIVYKGVLQTGSMAVKKLLNSQTIEDEPFYREATFLMGVKHKNIIWFLGYCANTEHKAIKLEGAGSRQKVIYPEIRERLLCFEYMSNGGLDSHLTDELRGLEWHTRYQIIKGICEGLYYLHKESIVHMDLKPANILLDDYMVPKITDFGISRYLDGVSRYVTEQCLVSLGYCAPEYLRGGEVSLKADIFSLGVIIRDIVTGRKQDIDNKNVLRRWRYRWNRSGKYPPLGYQQISKCIEISRRCMAENPLLRPYIWDIIIDQNNQEKTNEHNTNAVESMVGQIRPYPWELLDINPLELNFSFKANKQIHFKIELNNERGDYIAFNIQKPGILNYFIEPNKGIMPPHSRSSVTVTLQASNRAPDSMLCKDNFIVQCAIVDDGLTSANVNEDVFDTKSGKVVDEVMLTVAFT